jgi:sterol desaturase/sphingolipid hydroxylase (fatty acid hydroxylase superfamily)
MSDLAKWFVDNVVPTKAGQISLCIFVALIVVEKFVDISRNKRWGGGHVLSNLVSTFINMLVDVWAGGIFLIGYTAVFKHLRVIDVPDDAIGFVYAFFVIELITYLQHWMYHRVGIFWAMHSVHHSCPELNVAVTNRTLWALSLFIPMMLLIPLLGVSISQFAMVGIPRTLWAYALHTTLIPKLGVIDRWLNTPSDHRVHHGRQAKYLDRNYSQGFILFDRLFGTYQAEEEAPHYGLVKQIETKNPFKFQLAGFLTLYTAMRKADRWPDRLRYLYKPPGWSHTAEPMQSGQAHS